MLVLVLVPVIAIVIAKITLIVIEKVVVRVVRRVIVIVIVIVIVLIMLLAIQIVRVRVTERVRVMRKSTKKTNKNRISIYHGYNNKNTAENEGEGTGQAHRRLSRQVAKFSSTEKPATCCPAGTNSASPKSRPVSKPGESALLRFQVD